MPRRFARRSPSPIPQPSSRCRKRSHRPVPGLPSPALHLPAEPRLLCSDLVTLRLNGPTRAPREITAVLEEISPHSASLQLEELIPAETPVRFLFTTSAQGGELTGTVVQCLRQENLGFFAEVRFTPDCTWSPDRYRPLHLFDPRSLRAARETASEA